MARKSRRTVGTVAAAKVPETNTGYSTAIYARLSVENSGKDDDGDSIANQISFCEEFLKGMPDLNLYGIYEDNGEKGTHFDRPEFQRLMEDVRSGKVKCIVVKDLSRFGRDYIEAGQYLEKIFPFLGVRFISITDHYDSLTSKDAEGALMVPLKNMINDVYAKDISRKIITSFRARQERAEFLPAFPPYGYVKSQTEQYRYEVDLETAPYVRMIFEWKAAGVSHNEICKRLNEMGAVTPARRKVELGIWKAEKYKHTIWYGRTIIDIMQNPTYTGCIVYGRMTRSLYQGIKLHRTDTSEWKIFPDMHEPIISQELFEQVQDIFQKRKVIAAEKHAKSKALRELHPNLFKDKIFCGDCGKKMRYNRHVEEKATGGIWVHYVCGGFVDSGRTRCSLHTIPAAQVIEAVYSSIHAQMEIAVDQQKLLKELKGTKQESNLMDLYNGRLNHLSLELKKINNRRAGLSENYMDGILDAEEYKFAKQKYDEQFRELQEQIKEAQNKRDQLVSVLTDGGKWISVIRQVENTTELDQKLVDNLVKSVRIYEGRKVEVELNYGDEKRTYESILTELLEGGEISW